MLNKVITPDSSVSAFNLSIVEEQYAESKREKKKKATKQHHIMTCFISWPYTVLPVKYIPYKLIIGKFIKPLHQSDVSQTNET